MQINHKPTRYILVLFFLLGGLLNVYVAPAGYDHNAENENPLNLLMKQLGNEVRGLETINLNPKNKQEERVMDMATDVVGTAFKFGLNQIKNLEDERHAKITEAADLKKAAVTAHVSAKAAQEGETARANKMWEMLTNPRMLALWASVPVGIYASKLILDHVAKQWDNPLLVRESSRQGIKQSVQDYINTTILGKKSKPADLDAIVLEPEIDAAVKILAARAQKKHACGAPYRNLVLQGPPGTGKTAFAEALARYSGMDYALIKGGDFEQFETGKAVTEIHKLFDWAESSKKGLLMFFDEADAFAMKRENCSEKSRKILNTFISRCGDSSTKFMIVLATNHYNDLDSAVKSRMRTTFHFGLPGLEERIKILKKKIEKHIDGFAGKDNKTNKIIKLTTSPDITEEFLRSQAERMINFSGRDIDWLVIATQEDVLESDDKTLTPQMVTNATTAYIAMVNRDHGIKV